MEVKTETIDCVCCLQSLSKCHQQMIVRLIQKPVNHYILQGVKREKKRLKTIVPLLTTKKHHAFLVVKCLPL